MLLKSTCRTHALVFSISNLYRLPVASLSRPSFSMHSITKTTSSRKGGSDSSGLFSLPSLFGSGYRCTLRREFKCQPSISFFGCNINITPQNIDRHQYFLPHKPGQRVDHSHFWFVITHDSLTVQVFLRAVVGGSVGNEGLGTLSLSLDWSSVAEHGPLFTPLSTVLSRYAGAALRA